MYAADPKWNAAKKLPTFCDAIKERAMRCPKCGFISFDDLVACAKCNLQLEGKNALPFEGTAIRVGHAIHVRAAEAEPDEPEMMPAAEQDAADDVYKELAAGLGGEEEFDLALAEPEGEGEIALAAAEEPEDEIPVLETEEEIPALDLSGFGEEGTDEETAGAGEPETAADGAAGAETDETAEELELDLAIDDEEEGPEIMGRGDDEELDLASPGTAADLEGLDLSGLMGDEDEPDAGAADGNGSEIYDLSDLMTAEGDTDDLLAGDAEEEGRGEAAAGGEEMLDLTFDEEDGELAGEGPELDIDSGGAGEEELDLSLELEEEDEEKPAAAPEAEMAPSGLSLESEEDG